MLLELRQVTLLICLIEIKNPNDHILVLLVPSGKLAIK